ncbi:MAG: hypothetical protein OEW39_05055, partial [Deltaproteobacteria bacterium]|nr:hypothetical protein [Deltaproteobacteria bacterium]
MKGSVLGLLVLVGCLSLGMPKPVQAQDIVIFRPADRTEQTVTTPSYLLRVEISAFAPVEQVRINGQPVSHAKNTRVVVDKRLSLKPGRNHIVVDAKAGNQTVSQEFFITLKLPKSAEAYLEGEGEEPEAGFHMVTMLGAQRGSNPLHLPNPTGTTGGRRFLVVVPRYDFSLGAHSTFRLQGIASRESYPKKRFKSLEVEFTQLGAQWIKGAVESGEWNLGVGANAVDQRYRTLLQGRTRLENDQFVSLGYRN